MPDAPVYMKGAPLSSGPYAVRNDLEGAVRNPAGLSACLMGESDYINAANGELTGCELITYFNDMHFLKITGAGLPPINTS